jgi:signal transduction histidine kinase
MHGVVVARKPGGRAVLGGPLKASVVNDLTYSRPGGGASPRRCSLAALSLLILSLATPGYAQSDSKTVLVVYDGGREFAAIQLLDRGIEAALTEGWGSRVTVLREYMDLTRIHSPEYQPALKEFLRSKYSKDKPHVIIAIRGRSLDFLLSQSGDLFPGVPVVSSAMDIRQLQARTLPPHVTGRALRVTYWPTVELALQVQPGLEGLFIVLGASPNDRALEALVRDEFREHGSRVPCTYLAGHRTDELLDRLSRLPPRSAVLFVAFAQDGDGRAFLPSDALKMVSARANAPVYHNSEDVLDCGAVGGSLISFVEHGKAAGALASRVLRGEDPATIPIEASSARARTLDARVLERWGIPLEGVPSDCDIRNRPPKGWSWKEHWIPIAGTALLILAQAGLIAGLLAHRRRRRIAERDLEVSEASRLGAVLEERGRMARDMHDTLAQGFTGVIVQLEAAKTAMVHGAPTEADAHILRARDLAHQSLGEARRSLRALRPQALDKVDWWVALDALMKEMTAGSKLRAEFTTVGQPRGLAPSQEENLLRIHQEIVTNAIKHSRATSLVTTLSFEDKTVRLDVRDNGVGFDPAKGNDGLGLLGIRERVIQMNGEVSVESHVGIGTRVCIALPLLKAAGGA